MIQRDVDEMFDEAVREIAREEGVDILLSIPGVWELVSEHFNNDAISHIEDQLFYERQRRERL